MKLYDIIYDNNIIIGAFCMNISEFAQIAGVSKSAVSRYFNNGYLSEDKRQLIEKAIEKTGYSPSVSAQNIRTKVTKLVGVIIPKLSSESCARVTEGISRVLSEEGYELLLVNTANDYQNEIKYLDLFRQNRVDGVILLATVFTSLHRNILNKMHIPVVIVGQSYKGFSCVCHDDRGSAYALTKLMLDKGAQRPAYIGVTRDDKAAGEERLNGFTKAIAEKGLTVAENHKATAEFKIQSGYEQARRILSQKPYPDCLFCATDGIAAGALMYCIEAGIKIPSDLMVCGVGDSVMGQITAVPLTTAHLHYMTSGIEAARMLLSAIKRHDSVPRIMQLDYEIVERASTKK